ncbi:MAG: response regulator [Spirochaetales bacterium]
METQKHRILLVDDEESILRALERVLRGSDRELTTASDGPSALDLLATKPFDLIITDQRMPGMSGTELLKRVRQLHPLTARVMISGYAEFESLVAAVNEARVARFIPKPWDNDELRALVADVLQDK